MLSSQTAATTRISVDSSGAQTNGQSAYHSISADRCCVAFQSGATDLVAGDANGVQDIFVHQQAILPAPTQTNTPTATPTPFDNTPIGTNISVQPVDTTTGTIPVTLTFSQVTQSGTTSLTTSSSGPPPPIGFKLGNPPIYYEQLHHQRAGNERLVAEQRSAYPFVNLTGTTQFRLRFQLDDNDDQSADYILFYSGNSIAANRPALVIEFYVL